jgi:hypothetical protein
MDLIQRRKGNNNKALILILGINATNKFNSWTLENTGFDGSVYGLSWDNQLDSWNDLRSNDIARLVKGAVHFIKDYFRVCIQAETAGGYLADRVKYIEEEEIYIVSHSMGTRAAFTLLKSFNPERKTLRQVLLFNGAAPYSHSHYNFNNYRNKVSDGIINYYNPEDPVLSILGRVINKGIKFIPVLNVLIGQSGIFDPIGLKHVDTVTTNQGLFDIQNRDHSAIEIIKERMKFDGNILFLKR